MTTELIGYTDKLSVAPGESVQFMVSTDLPSYDASVVRLIHGDENAAGPGFKEERVETEIDGPKQGRIQVARIGSYALVRDHPTLAQLTSFTLQAWIWPTTPQSGEPQGLLSKWSDNTGGFSLALGEQGALELWLGGEVHNTRVSTGRTMRAGEWYFVAASFERSTGLLKLVQLPRTSWPSDPTSVSVEESVSTPARCRNEQPMLMAATALETNPSSSSAAQGLFNGKIDSPCLFSRALKPGEIRAPGIGHASRRSGWTRSGRVMGLLKRPRLNRSNGLRSPPAAWHLVQHAYPRRYRPQLDLRGNRPQASFPTVRRHSLPPG